MKLFIKKTILFILILVAVLVLLDVLSMFEPTRTLLAELTDSKAYISLNVGADEIKPYIKKVQEHDETTKLILGDSVCHQLFNDLQPYSTEISIVGSNAAITVAGQYVLASEYINSHPNATDIYLFMLPGSLTQSFDTNYGYQYTVMPFVETGTIKYFDNDTVKTMEDVYGKFFMNPIIVRMIDLSAPNRKIYLNLLKKYSAPYKPSNYFDIAEKYIGKIKDLCDANNITLHLYPCPISESRKNDIDALKDSYTSSKLNIWFPAYFDEIRFYPEYQSDDNVHFSDEYSDRNFLNSIILEYYGDFITITEDDFMIY